MDYSKDEQLLIAVIKDKIKAAEKRGMPVNTGFLDLASRALAEDAVRNCGCLCCFCGGYEDAERRVLIIDGRHYGGELSADAAYQDIFSVLRVSVPKGGKPLSHRDYLGAILGLGIKRDIIGDILVREDGADVICLSDMSDYLKQNLCQVGRANVSCSVHGISELNVGEVRTEEIRDTLASLRLDAAVAGVFKVSRTNAQEAVRQGMVCVNNRQVMKPDYEISEGDKISLRGKGKAVLKETGGKSRKDRLYVVFERYV